MILRRLVHGERAASLVEFAIIAPLLAVITLGILDVGRAFPTYLVLLGGAREGAYYLASHSQDTPGAVSRVIETTSRMGLNAADIVVTPSGGNEGDTVSVRVQHTMQFTVGFLPQSSVNMDVTVSMEAIQ